MCLLNFGTYGTTVAAAVAIYLQPVAWSFCNLVRGISVQHFHHQTFAVACKNTTTCLTHGVLGWLSVWSKVEICMWPRWYHCHSLSLASINPDWFYLSGRLVHTHTHNRFTALLEFVRDHPGEQVPEGKTRKVKTNLDLLEQEIVSGSGICRLVPAHLGSPGLRAIKQLLLLYNTYSILPHSSKSNQMLAGMSLLLWGNCMVTVSDVTTSPYTEVEQLQLLHTHTDNTQPFYGSVEFVRENPGEPVPEETFTHYSHRSHQSSLSAFSI